VSIRSTSLVLDTFAELDYDLDQVYLILNWTFPRKGISPDDIERFLNKKISLKLPYASDELLHGVNYGSPPTYATPEKVMGVIFEDLAFSLSKSEHLARRPDKPSAAWSRVAKRHKAKYSY
jgi:hypothetical protein